MEAGVILVAEEGIHKAAVQTEVAMAKGQATEEAILKGAMAEACLAIHIHLKVHKCVVDAR